VSLTKILLAQQKRQRKYFENYVAYARKLKEIVVGRIGDPNIRLLVFGSVVRGEALPGRSDIDILVISDAVSLSASWQSGIRTDMLLELGDFFSPFEIHFATRELYDSWYSRFIGSQYLEIE